jgi:hypothetical protein
MFEALFKRLRAFFTFKKKVKYAVADVESMVFKQLLHLEEERVLVVTFNNDKVYWYENVPKTLYDALMRTDSKGSFWYWAIKIHPETYPYHLMEEEECLT